MNTINRLNLTSSHSALSHALHSLSDLSNDSADTTVTEANKWNELTEEQRQDYFNQVKATVLSGDTDLEDYKNAFKDAFEEDTTLADDDIIWAIAMDLDGPDMDGVVLTMKGMQDEGIATGDEVDEAEALSEVKAEVSSLADKLSADADFKADVSAIIAAKETVARGPVTVLLHLERIWDAGDWAKVPEPGSKAPEKGKPSNITIWDITPTKRGNRKINVSWFEEHTKAVFPKVWDDLADINETFKSADERDLNNQQRRDFMKLPPLKRRAMQGTFSARKSAHLNLMRSAVRIRRLKAELKGLTNKDGKHPIGVEFAWETHPIKANNYKGVLLPGSKPILVFDGLAPIPTEKVGDAYTTMTFLKFEAGLKKMVASGVDPSYTELDATLQRNREAMAAQKRANRFKIDNMDDFIYSMLSNANFIDDKGGKGENLRQFKKHLESKKKVLEEGADKRLMTEYEQEIFTFGSMMMDLQPIYAYVKSNGFDALWEANNKGEKLTHDDVLTEEDKAKAEEKKAKAA